MKLFESTTVKGMDLANRFVRSATHENLAKDDGSVTEGLIELLVRLAEGGVGLILPGYAYVLKDGQTYPRQNGVHDDALLPGLEKLTSAVHNADGKIALQIVHGGVHADAEVTGTETAGPSVLTTDDGPICRSMKHEDIETVVVAFREAAVRAKKAGFDAVQLHAAHGYLLSQFISPFYNRRKDDYGGSLKNRSRLLLQVYRNVRDAVGDSYPVLVKLNTTDFLDDGLKPAEAIQIARLLDAEGIDVIELSGGTVWGFAVLGDVNKACFRNTKEDAYYRATAKEMKQEIKTPIILTGGIRSYETARDLVETGVVDYVGLCRPLIREPDLVKRWANGDTRQSECVSDNACFGPIQQGKGPVCVLAKA